MSILHNDEGMWLPYKLPVARLEKIYGFTPGKEWAEHVQKASARMNSGGSASFVSPNGLLATNHHVAETLLQEMSSLEKDYVKDGFFAERIEDEVKVPNEEVNVLWETEDVTGRVTPSVKPGMTSAQAHEARKETIIRIQKESFERTGMRSDVVTLYQGGAYHLYRYKKYTDVRLVFAPEYAIAGLGSDIDNYEFPRYNLDVAFFRVYENGKPAETPHYFKWAAENPKEGDLFFVVGHPGSTDRLSTLARLKSLRDFGLPYQLTLLRRQEITLQQFAGRNKENKRIAHNELHRVQNIRKRYLGQLSALQDPAFLKQKEKKERALKQRVNDSGMWGAYGTAWEEVARAEAYFKTIRNELNFFESGLAFNTRLFGIARALVRLVTEDKKPDHKRLSEYTDAERESLRQRLLSPAPIHKHFEEWKLADSLALFAETFGFDDREVQRILRGKSPSQRARELVLGTTLHLPERRKLLLEGHRNCGASDDTMIQLALLVDRRARRIRKDFEENVEEPRRQAYAKIAQAQFDAYGDAVYPDATFTLRVAFGRILGYKDGGVQIPPFTTVGQTFAHADVHENKEPWELPKRWTEKRKELETSMAAFNFVSTHDAHGGNSGSPVIDENLFIHGLLFDGNIHDNAGTFLYTDVVGRSISVSAAGTLDALKKAYKVPRLTRELLAAV